MVQAVRDHLVDEVGFAADEIPLEFWRIEDPDARELALERLRLGLQLSELPGETFAALPKGYGIVRYVLAFEHACLWGGWQAVGNAGAEEMGLVSTFYEAAGLGAEAKAISAVTKQWMLTPGDQQAAARAYASVPNEWSDGEARLSYIEEQLVAGGDSLFGA